MIRLRRKLPIVYIVICSLSFLQTTMESQQQQFRILVADETHQDFAQIICDEMAASAAARGTGIAKRSPEYIKDIGTPQRYDRICGEFASGVIARSSFATPQRARAASDVRGAARSRR